LVPELLRIFGATASPDTALLRFDHFLSLLPAGVQLFSLFHANPGLLSLVADIMAEAPLLAESLAQRPALLDAVLTAEFSAPLPDRAGLAADLGGLTAGARDFQDTLDILRRWANERRFQRSEEHTSELQSLAYLVCRLLLEKKKLSTISPHCKKKQKKQKKIKTN